MPGELRQDATVNHEPYSKTYMFNRAFVAGLDQSSHELFRVSFGFRLVAGTCGGLNPLEGFFPERTSLNRVGWFQ
jgi:hypothetical protein